MPLRPSLVLSQFTLPRRPPQWRAFTLSSPLHAKPLPPRKAIADEDIEENFLKGSGPGGQKINKTNSAVQLKHLPTGIVVKIQETRSRRHNRKIARRVLADRLEEIELGDQSRTALKRQAAAKKKASKAKKARRKYRKLEGESGGIEDEDEDDDEDALVDEPLEASDAAQVGALSDSPDSKKSESQVDNKGTADESKQS